MLTPATTLLIVTDIQGNLARLMYERESLYRNASILIDGMKTLGVPILWVEQYPQGLGPTIPEIASHLDGLSPLPKRSFSSLREPEIRAAFDGFGRPQIVICGIETHVCVYQTSMDIIASGAEVHVPVDAVSSRTELNRQVGLDRIARAGGHLTSVETVLFELLATSEAPAFKDIIRLVK